MKTTFEIESLTRGFMVTISNDNTNDGCISESCVFESEASLSEFLGKYFATKVKPKRKVFRRKRVALGTSLDKATEMFN